MSKMTPQKLSFLVPLLLATLTVLSLGRAALYPSQAASSLEKGVRSVPASHYRAGDPLPPVVSRVPPSPFVSGEAALVPHTTAVDPSGARITADETRNYLITHGLLQSTSPETVALITKIRFLPSAQVRPLLGGDPTGRPDTDLLCYVEVQGPITIGVISVPRGIHPARFHKGVVVFDAQTGNLLID